MKRLLLLSLIISQALLLKAQGNDDYTNPSKKRTKRADTAQKRANPAGGETIIVFQQDDNSKPKDKKHGSNGPITHYFSISTDIIQYAIFQPNVGIEYRRDNIAFGFNYGVVLPDPSLTTNPFPTYQYEWPGEIYKGNAIRLYAKWFFNPDNQVSYLSAAGLLRFLSYNNVSFTDLLVPDSVTMNENAVGIGVDFLYGQEWTPFSFLHIDLFIGLGLRALLRQYTVLATNIPNQMPLGPGSSTVYYAAPVLGFKMGFNLFYK